MRRVDDDDPEVATLVPCPRCVGPDEDVANGQYGTSDCALCGDLRLVSADLRRMWIEAGRQ